MKKKAIFWILLVLSFLSAVLSWVNYSKDLKYNLINVIVETKIQNSDDILLKLDDKYYSFKQFDNVLNQTIKNKVESIELLINKNHKNKIKNIIVFNDIKMHQYFDFSTFEKTSEEFCTNNSCKIYDKYKFNNEIKYIPNSKIINDSFKLNIFSKGILNFFEGKNIFLLSYVFLFISILYFINNFQEFKFNQIAFIFGILILAILLRINGLNQYMPWWDENYSINATLANLNFTPIFKDPGNPWFYYLILKIFNLIFHPTYIGMKVLSITFGIFCNLSIYYFLKKFCSQKSANISLVLSCVNIVLIYYSQEIRCYILQALFVVLFSYLIFKILEKNDKKYYIAYFILLFCAINTHYYQIFLMISNFLFLSFFFIKEKQYKSLLNFTLLNFVAILTFLPYFFYCALNEAMLNSAFNDHLPNINLALIKNIILYIFGGLTSLLLSIVFFIKTLKNKEVSPNTKRILVYSFYTIFSILIIALIFSLIIRPMIIQRYFAFLVPLFIIFLSIILSLNYKKRVLFLFLSFIWIFCIQSNYSSNLETIKKKCMIDNNVLELSNKYFEKHQNKNIYVIYKRVGFNFETLINKKIKYYNLDEIKKDSNYEKETLKLISKIKKEDKKAIIFTSIILPKSKDYTCYFNSSQDMCIYKFE